MTCNKIKILFIGTVEFSFKALQTLFENKFEITGIIKKKESKFNSDFYDLSTIAKENNIPIIYRTKDNVNELVSFINLNKSDVIYCFGWSHILPTSILSIPKYGVIGFHPAELPNNRGRHPIIWALFLGLKQTASTFFVMDEGTDTGDIISQEKIKISDDNANSLYNKIIDKALKQIISFTINLEINKGVIDKIEQDKTEGNSWRKRNKNDGKIDFRMHGISIVNLVKSLNKPYVGAHVELMDKEVKIWEVRVEVCELNNHEPGKVLLIENNEILVKTYDGAVRLIDHEFKNNIKVGQYL